MVLNDNKSISRAVVIVMHMVQDENATYSDLYPRINAQEVMPLMSDEGGTDMAPDHLLSLLVFVISRY